MSVPASSSYSKMSWARDKSKSSGWAAFDLKQRQKQGLLPQVEDDPFPPMPSSLPTIRSCENMSKNNDLSERPFSSVLIPSVNFPALEQNKDSIRLIQVGNSGEKHGSKVEQSNKYLALEKLKKLHSWADKSLIEDVLLAADNNIDKASTLLRGMVSMSITKGTKKSEIKELSSSVDDFQCKDKCDTSAQLGSNAGLVGLSSTTQERKDNLKEPTDLHASFENKFSNDAANLKLILGQLSSMIIEPEWEEDDVYLSHRKDAIRMMRSAAKHSKAATNAFLRGDHFSARQQSQKAQEEWSTAQRLNAKAAREILSIRNSESDMWKLDLHGLHAAEAVQALQERLSKVETQVPANCSTSSNRLHTNNESSSLSSVGTLESTVVDNMENHYTSFRQRPMSLQVITGIGNHSRGQAALPTAVRSFLVETGYRFDEPRPGVITVRPKFRHS